MVTPERAQLPGGEPASLQSVRRHNLARVLRALRSDGPMSRAALATHTGLTKVTLSSIAAELLERGLVREQSSEHAAGQAGRPSRPLSLDPDGAAGLGLWIDVDRLGVCLTDLGGQPRFTRMLRRDNARSRPATVLRHLARLSAEAVDHAAERGLRIVAATLSVPGLVDSSRGHLYLAPNLNWSDLPLAEQLAEQLAPLLPGLPQSRLANEANAAAIAERAAQLAVGRGQGERSDQDSQGNQDSHGDFLFVTLGVGVGAGVVQNGVLFRGARGFGGELGHAIVVPDGPRCACGNRGCLEALVGRDALLKRARKRLGSALPGSTDPDAALDALHSLALARDPGALEVLGEVAQWLAIALTNYANLLDPAAIILGGYGARFADLLMPPITRHLERSLLSARWAPCTIHPATTGTDAPLLGAGLLSLEALFDDPGCLSVPAI